MLIETASSQQQPTVAATLNLDHHPSAFHRVTANAASTNGNETGTHNTHCDCNIFIYTVLF